MSSDLKTLVLIRDAARALVEHAAGQSRRDFDADRKTRSAVLFEIVLIGEGVKRLSPELIGRHPDVAWTQAVGMRNRVVHEFDKIQFDIVWDVVQIHVPAMLDALDQIIAKEGKP